MRNLIVSIAAVLIFFTGSQQSNQSSQSSQTRSTNVDVGNGRIAWFDITTSDMTKSKDFYGKLFDWKFAPVEGTDVVAFIVAGTTPIGTLRVGEGKPSVFNGVVYIQVADLIAKCSKVKELGATVVEGFPINVPGGIAIALLVDPAGHPIGMYSRTPIPTK